MWLVQAFLDVFGDYAGWAHNALFISELASHKHLLQCSEAPAQQAGPHASLDSKQAPSHDATVHAIEEAVVAEGAQAKVDALSGSLTSARDTAAAAQAVHDHTSGQSKKGRQQRARKRRSAEPALPPETYAAPSKKRKAKRVSSVASGVKPKSARSSLESAATAHAAFGL